MNLKLNKSIKYLIFFVTVGLVLRLLYFHDLTFGYDQARDALESISIIKNFDIKIIGPTTDIRGLFHSPLFWYIISPFYYFSGGNPEIARIPMILISLANIVFIYFFAKKLFKDEKIALLSSFFMAISFEAVQYARWLSNPPPALLTIGIFFYGLWLVVEKKKIGLPLMVLSWGFSVAFQFFLAYQIIFIFFGFGYLLITSRKTLIDSVKKYYWLYLATFIPLSFYILAQIKFKFIGLMSLLSHLTKNQGSSNSIFSYLIAFSNSLIEDAATNFTFYNFSIARWFLIIFSLAIIYLILKKKQLKIMIFLLVWFISPLIIYPIGNNDSYFLNFGILYPLIMLTIFVFLELGKFVSLKHIQNLFLVIFIGLVISSNLFLIITNNKGGEFLFSVQYKQNLNDEKKIVDYVYKSSKGKIFAFNTLTNPLYINTTWAYVFDWYGKNKYGFLPVWWGAYLDDFGKEIKFTQESKLNVGDKIFLIIEPLVFHEDYKQAYIRFENKRSKLVKRMQFGTHYIEERQIIKLKGFSRDEISKLLQVE